MAAVEEAPVLEDVLDANIDRLLDASDFTFRLRFRNPVAWRPGLMENDILGESRLLQDKRESAIVLAIFKFPSMPGSDIPTLDTSFHSQREFKILSDRKLLRLSAELRLARYCPYCSTFMVF